MSKQTATVDSVVTPDVAVAPVEVTETVTDEAPEAPTTVKTVKPTIVVPDEVMHTSLVHASLNADVQRGQLRDEAVKFAHDTMATPDEAEKLIHLLQPFYSGMVPDKAGRVVNAWVLCEQALIHIGAWRSAQDNETLERARLDVQSTLVHLAQRAPKSVRGNDVQTSVLRALTLVAQSIKNTPISASPIDEAMQGKARIAAVNRAAQADRRAKALAAAQAQETSVAIAAAITADTIA